MPNGNVGTLKCAVGINNSFEEFSAAYAKAVPNLQTRKRLWLKQQADRLYLSEHFQVAIDKDPPHAFPGALLWHLSIKRIDKEPIMDWRDLQAIKSQLCGPEAEAIQLYPAESRVVDGANQYHLWVFMKMGGMKLPRLPVGWFGGFVNEADIPGAKQREKESDHG